LLSLLTCYADLAFKENIQLDSPPVPWEKLSVKGEYILAVDEGNTQVWMLDLKGKKVSILKDQYLQLPYKATWIPNEERVYIYDAASRSFFLFKKDGSLDRKIQTDYDLLFQVGNLHKSQTGFIAPVSLTEGKFLVAYFDQDMKPQEFTYRLLSQDLVNLSPVLRRTFVSKVMINEAPYYLVTQSLSRTIQSYDGGLALYRSYLTEPPDWRSPNMKKLAKVSTNPKELRKYGARFSEVVGLEAFDNGYFVTGYRNLKGKDLFTYILYALDSGKPQGEGFDSTKRIFGASGTSLFLTSDEPSQVVEVVHFLN
jgi:hypothetical protein